MLLDPLVEKCCSLSHDTSFDDVGNVLHNRTHDALANHTQRCLGRVLCRVMQMLLMPQQFGLPGCCSNGKASHDRMQLLCLKDLRYFSRSFIYTVRQASKVPIHKVLLRPGVAELRTYQHRSGRSNHGPVLLVRHSLWHQMARSFLRLIQSSFYTFNLSHLLILVNRHSFPLDVHFLPTFPCSSHYRICFLLLSVTCK